ncbi:MAG: hypothetical protein K5873_01780 [Treponema sp.]|nr:hypothetical protein [Treponema sp.]
MKSLKIGRRFTFRFFSLLVFFPLFFISCADVEKESGPAEETLTLRYTANSLYDSTLWTEALEVDRLTSSVNSIPGISSKLNLTPLIVAAGVPAEDSVVFPNLKDFGSLDTTLIPSSLRKMLESFTDSLSKYMDADSFFSKDCLYSLALFYSDFKNIFGQCFQLDKKSEEKSQNPENSLKKDGADNVEDQEGGENPEEKTVLEAYFTSTVIGQPFLDGIYYQIPVKFLSDKAVMTLCLFCFEENGSWKIDQIQISDWEIFNGEK